MHQSDNVTIRNNKILNAGEELKHPLISYDCEGIGDHT
jgi:hypothetical protein